MAWVVVPEGEGRRGIRTVGMSQSWPGEGKRPGDSQSSDS